MFLCLEELVDDLTRCEIARKLKRGSCTENTSEIAAHLGRYAQREATRTAISFTHLARYQDAFNGATIVQFKEELLRSVLGMLHRLELHALCAIVRL